MIKNIIAIVVIAVSAAANAQVTLGKLEAVESRLLAMMATNQNPAELRDLAAAVKDIKLSRAVDVEARLAGLIERAVAVAPTAIRAMKSEIAKTDKVDPMLDFLWEAGAAFLEGDDSFSRVMTTLPKAWAAQEKERLEWIEKNKREHEAREAQERQLGPIVPR